MTEARVSPSAPPIAPHQAQWQDHGLTPRQVRLTLIGVMLAMFLASLDQTIVATAIPRIMADLDGFDRVTWVSTAYIVASTSVVLITGAVSDVYGRKWLYVGGIAIFLVGSVLAATSPTMNALIIFRAIQGVGGGMMMALSFVTIGDLFPPSERAKYQEIIAAMFGISSVLGPTLGGFITDQLSWHWIFLVNIPLGVPIIFLFVRLFPNSKKTGPTRKIDAGGAVLIVLAIVPALLGLSWGGNQFAWSSPQVISALTMGGVMVVVFALYETRVTDPILPLAVFRNRTVGIALLVTLLTGFAMFGAIFFVPLLFQGVLGASPTASGSFLTPMMLGIVFGAASSSHWRVLSNTGDLRAFCHGHRGVHAQPGYRRNHTRLRTDISCDHGFRPRYFVSVVHHRNPERGAAAISWHRNIVRPVLQVDWRIDRAGSVRFVHGPTIQRRDADELARRSVRCGSPSNAEFDHR
ncbi:MAG: MDR family MFS transporter [Chloroflexi bacterium]|nr:MDR family MFS transporter [Chloroflexota bacterium]